MTSPTLKIGALTMGIGGAAVGSGIAVKNYLNTSNEVTQKEDAPKAETQKTQSIVNLLKSENMTLIGQNEDKETIWKPKWDEFKKAHNTAEPQGLWKITDWAKNRDNDTGLEAFKKLCETNGAKEVENKNDDIYTKVKSYCTKPITTKHE